MRVVPPEEIEQQRQQFETLMEKWGAVASAEEVDAFLASREIAEPEPELTSKLIANLQAQMDAARSQRPIKDLAAEPV